MSSCASMYLKNALEKGTPMYDESRCTALADHRCHAILAKHMFCSVQLWALMEDGRVAHQEHWSGNGGADVGPARGVPHDALHKAEVPCE